MAHWRESVEEDEEKDSSPASTRARTSAPSDIARRPPALGRPERVIAQIEAYRVATGADHVHAAFGAGPPGRHGPGLAR